MLNYNHNSLHPQVVDWAHRVQLNGGGDVSRQTVWAADHFYKALSRNGLDKKMKAVNFFSPDNITASFTPLINSASIGFDPWTPKNFVSSDLTIDGLKGDGSAKRLLTGITASMIWTSQSFAGLSLYVSVGSNGSEQDMGALSPGLSQPIEHNALQLHVSVGGSCVADEWSDGTSGRINVANSLWTGYISLNRTSTSTSTVYKASSTTAHTTLGSNSNNNSTWGPPSGSGISVFCGTSTEGPFSFSTKRLSFAAIHDGLTAAESLLFFNAIQQLRQDLGGGYK